MNENNLVVRESRAIRLNDMPPTLNIDNPLEALV